MGLLKAFAHLVQRRIRLSARLPHDKKIMPHGFDYVQRINHLQCGGIVTKQLFASRHTVLTGGLGSLAKPSIRLSSQPSQGIKVGFKYLNLLYRAIGPLSFDNPLLAVTKHNIENRFCHYPCLSAAFPDISTTLCSVNSLQKWMPLDAGLSEDANRMRRTGKLKMPSLWD
jgi:hypothetical protein